MKALDNDGNELRIGDYIIRTEKGLKSLGKEVDETSIIKDIRKDKNGLFIYLTNKVDSNEYGYNPKFFTLHPDSNLKREIEEINTMGYRYDRKKPSFIDNDWGFAAQQLFVPRYTNLDYTGTINPINIVTLPYGVIIATNPAVFTDEEIE